MLRPWTVYCSIFIKNFHTYANLIYFFAFNKALGVPKSIPRNDGLLIVLNEPSRLVFEKLKELLINNINSF